MSDKKEKTEEAKQGPELVRQIFDDFESRRNIVGLYDLVYKIDRRINPHLYATPQPNNKDHD